MGLPIKQIISAVFPESSLLPGIVLNPREIEVNKTDLPLSEPTEKPLVPGLSSRKPSLISGLA